MLLAESVTPLGAPMQTRLLALLALVFVVAVSAPGSARATTPGANGPLAFELFSPATGFTGQVARISPHGTNRRVLTAPAPGEPPQPEWSPDGRRIAFVRCTGEESSCNVWVMRRNGTHQRQVTHCAPQWCFGNLSPAWSPDGRWILFERDQRNGAGENRPGLFLIRPGGTQMHRLTRAPIDRDTSHTEGQYSPDGRWIVFTQVIHESEDPNHLFVISANGGSAHRLTPPGLDSDNPDWSPDGGWIIFTGHPQVPGVEFTANIYVIHPDGSGMRRLTHSKAGEGFDFFASWSPNGARIVFNHADPQVDDLFTMNRRGTAIRRVTHTKDVFELRADWGAAIH